MQKRCVLLAGTIIVQSFFKYLHPITQQHPCPLWYVVSILLEELPFGRAVKQAGQLIINGIVVDVGTVNKGNGRTVQTGNDTKGRLSLSH